MSALARWLGRKAALFVILVLAVGFFTLAWPAVRSGVANGDFAADWMSPAQLRAELDAARATTQLQLEQDVDAFRTLGEAEQARRLATATAQLAEARRRRQAAGGFLDRFRPSKILERKKLDLRISQLELEIAALNELGQENSARRQLDAARSRAEALSRVPTEAAVNIARNRCRSATLELQAFDQRLLVDRSLRNILRGERAELLERQQERCTFAERAAARRRAGFAALQAAQDAQARYDDARDWTAGRIADASSGIGNTVIRNIITTAALLFVLILALPLLIRLLFYFVLAPVAERRPAVVLAGTDQSSATVPLPPPSRTSVSVPLGEGEELLVRQGFLQSSSEAAAKSTRWLLDWRHPLSSVASGMTFLTRIHGDGAATTVSAVNDPFAEVTLVDLPGDAAIVMHPRALAAVVQPIARPLRVTSHWRLASLHAWLTLQLRYLVFHGPARLIVKGSRGVRAERAVRGRIFGQHQLVGFSTDLAYSVRRTETFWPYFLGRDQLLKDRAEGDAGLLIVEEAPLAGNRGRVRSGLEGAFDAGLKAFGL